MSTPDPRAPGSSTPTPVFVGLDLSLASTGFACIDSAGITVDRIKTKPAGQNTAEQAARLSMIVNHVLARIPITEHTHVAIEGPAFGSNDRGAHVRGGLWWAIRRELHAEDIDTVIIPPSSVKKYATGKGNAQKDAVLAAVIRRYPHVDVTGNDEADALVLAAMCARLNGQPIDPGHPTGHTLAMSGIGR